MSDFFQEWSDLYKNDPVEYERRRTESIEQVISSAPEHSQLKLRQLQWKLDVIHQTRNPLAATIAMSKMMWESVEVMKTGLMTLSEKVKSNIHSVVNKKEV